MMFHGNISDQLNSLGWTIKERTCWPKEHFLCRDIWSICNMTSLSGAASSPSDPSLLELAANKSNTMWKWQDHDHPTSADGCWGDVRGRQSQTSKLLLLKAEGRCWYHLMTLLGVSSLHTLRPGDENIHKLIVWITLKQIPLSQPIWMWRAGEAYSMLQLGTVPAAPSCTMGSF